MKVVVDVTKMFKDGNVPKTCETCPFKQYYAGADEWGEYEVSDVCYCDLIALGCYGDEAFDAEIDEGTKLDHCPLKAVE